MLLSDRRYLKRKRAKFVSRLDKCGETLNEERGLKSTHHKIAAVESRLWEKLPGSFDNLKAKSLTQIRFGLEEHILIQSRNFSIFLTKDFLVQLIDAYRFLGTTLNENVTHYLRDKAVKFVLGNFL